MKIKTTGLIALSLGLASGQSLGAGFALNSQSATGIGRAMAGDAIIADNASVMARNPAAMAMARSIPPITCPTGWSRFKTVKRLASTFLERFAPRMKTGPTALIAATEMPNTIASRT